MWEWGVGMSSRIENDCGTSGDIVLIQMDQNVKKGENQVEYECPKKPVCLPVITLKKKKRKQTAQEKAALGTPRIINYFRTKRKEEGKSG